MFDISALVITLFVTFVIRNLAIVLLFTAVVRQVWSVSNCISFVLDVIFKIPLFPHIPKPLLLLVFSLLFQRLNTFAKIVFE